MEVKRDSKTKMPVVDLSNPNIELVARAVVKASEEWGIFQLTNHGIPTELIQQLKEVGRQFFELPEAEKDPVAKPADSTDVLGYQSNFHLQGSRLSHLFHNLSPSSLVNYTYWPKNPPQYREVTEEYARHAKKLAEKILGWLSEGLGLQREALKVALGDDRAGYLLRINYYQPCTEPDLVVGLAAHSDINGLTLLLPNEVPGLQVSRDGHWLDTEYKSPAIIVVIGDQIMKMSNARYNNVYHRAVLDKEKTRMSWVVLIKPAYDMVIKPFPELVNEHNPPKFEPLSYKDYTRTELSKQYL